MNNDPGKPRLLLVDDVPANLHVLVAALRNDYRIKTATSGPAALDLAGRAERPDLILLDVMMPGMNGIEVLRRLRAEKPTAEIPVIFVSADSSEQSQLEGLELGADDYLTKPVVPTVLLARVRNILQRKQAEAQLRLASHVFEYSGEAIVITDENNLIANVNPAFTRITGYTLEEVRGRDPKLLASGRTTKEEYGAMWEALLHDGFWHGEMWDRHKDGGVYPKLITISVVRNVHGDIDSYIASFTNISEQKEAEAKIHHIAHHDPLTGLPNRLHLQAVLEQSLALARREGSELALMFVDLDRFKDVNDSLGHTVGDALLVEVAHRLRESCRESDFVARLGGDEFVVALSGAEVTRAAEVVAEKILTGLAEPCHIGAHEIRTTPSVGIAVFPRDGDSIDVLMNRADAAMYQAKGRGRNNVVFFGTGTGARP
jgi:diguanylate cyclase (GGDEF)-like protein/PAS domain S-box-containing protein